MTLKRLSLTIILLQLFVSSVAMAEGDAQSREPTEIKHDWVQLTSGEWLSGKIHAMYDKKLEFDSEKLDLLTIKWDDVNRLQSYQIFLVNIDEGGEQSGVLKGRPLLGSLNNDDGVYTGTLNVSGNDITVTTAEGVKSFNRSNLISFAPGGEGRIDLWTAKLGLSLNIQEGNTQQLDYTAKASAIRRTAKTRFTLDYIGNVSATGTLQTGSTKTVENHRVNAISNIYITRYFFYTPFEVEYYRDSFRNIDRRLTLGAGLGYVVIDKKEMIWEVSGGPSALNTRYISVQQGESASDTSFALMLGTHVETDITSTLELDFQYDIKVAKKEAGGYTHHAIASFENEITGHIDLDISFLWDRTSYPTADENGVTPKADDYRLMMGVNYSFN